MPMCCRLLAFMVFDGTRVRSAISTLKRMIFHIGSTRPFHVYMGMYSGMCVWYDTTCGQQKRLRKCASGSRPLSSAGMSEVWLNSGCMQL